jgi:hypothetical protein
MPEEVEKKFSLATFGSQMCIRDPDGPVSVYGRHLQTARDVSLS